MIALELAEAPDRSRERMAAMTLADQAPAA
jgi:hypothetical protein